MFIFYIDALLLVLALFLLLLGFMLLSYTRKGYPLV